MAEGGAVDPATRPDVVVVDHYDSYTWNLVHLVAAVTGELPTVVEHDATTLDQLSGYTHIVLSPGPGHPGDPADFALGAGVFELGLPVLGVCLGMQALVHFNGGTIAPIEPAHGVVAQIEHDGTGLLRDVPSPFAGVRYHSLAAVTVPDELRVTAWAPQRAHGRPDVVMAVEHRDKALWGVQYHPESILTEYGAAVIGRFLS